MIFLDLHWKTRVLLGDKCYEPEMDRFSGDMSIKEGITSAYHCLLLCKSTEECLGITYSETYETCHLKNPSANKTPLAGFLSADIANCGQ